MPVTYPGRFRGRRWEGSLAEQHSREFVENERRVFSLLSESPDAIECTCSGCEFKLVCRHRAHQRHELLLSAGERLVEDLLRL